MNNKKKRQAYVSAITNGHKYIGSKNNDYRVNQNSLFGERRYNENPSIAQKILNGIADKLHLTSPPTFKDGYNRTLNAEVPLSESAQGQELKRIGSTALKGMTIAGTAALPFSFYYAPLATTAGIATGAAATGATNLAMNAVERGTGKKFTPGQRTAATFLTSLPAGIKGYKWGWGAEKRAIESAMTASGGASIPVQNLKITYRKILDPQMKKYFAKYILTGKGKQPTEILGPANSYTGNGEGWFAPNEQGNMVRAYLYDEPLPELHEVIGPGKYGPHDKYILEKYPNKYGKIRVYEGNEVGNNPTTDLVTPIKSYGENSDINFKHSGGIHTVDAGGHIVQEGLGENGLYRRAQDIWKFKPDEYKGRWLAGRISNPLIDWGLNIVDSHGTPVVTRTTWGRESIPRFSIENNPNGITFDPWYKNISDKVKEKAIFEKFENKTDLNKLPDLDMTESEFLYEKLPDNINKPIPLKRKK